MVVLQSVLLSTFNLSQTMSLIPFLVAAAVLALTPGPGSTYVVARTVAGGRAEGLGTVLALARREAT